MNKRKLIFAVLLMAVFVFNIKAQDSKTVIIDQVVDFIEFPVSEYDSSLH